MNEVKIQMNQLKNAFHSHIVEQRERFKNASISSSSSSSSTTLNVTKLITNAESNMNIRMKSNMITMTENIGKTTATTTTTTTNNNNDNNNNNTETTIQND
jgi:tetrahydromethanopterin S-methyltransferase subunit A